MSNGSCGAWFDGFGLHGDDGRRTFATAARDGVLAGFARSGRSSLTTTPDACAADVSGCLRAADQNGDRDSAQ